MSGRVGESSNLEMEPGLVSAVRCVPARRLCGEPHPRRKQRAEQAEQQAVQQQVPAAAQAEGQQEMALQTQRERAGDTGPQALGWAGCRHIFATWGVDINPCAITLKQIRHRFPHHVQDFFLGMLA